MLGDNDNNVSLEQIDSAEHDMVNRITYEQLLKEFDRFNPVHKQICLLFYQDNLTVDQIGKTLNMSSGTIKSILSRTRTKIIKHFKQ